MSVAASQRAPTLGTSTADPQVAQMFADLAPDYDRMNALITFGLADAWRRELVGRATPAGNCLDLGCGTGDLTQAVLADTAALVTGFDLTRPMLRGAVARMAHGRVAERARFVQGDAEKLPFQDATFDTVVSSFLMRNVADRASAYREVARVLKPGGRFLQLELAKPERPLLRRAFLLYFHYGMPRLASLFSRHRDAFKYLAESIDRWPQPNVVGEEIKAGGFAKVEQVRELFGGVALHIATK